MAKDKAVILHVSLVLNVILHSFNSARLLSRIRSPEKVSVSHAFLSFHLSF